MGDSPHAGVRDAAPLVSAITIFLDEEDFLDEAIESVVAQTYPNWELLLCDDGSSDGSQAIAAAWVERYPDRIRYLTHPEGENRGMSATRNLGIENARGEYLAFLDGDDVWLPTKLERQLGVLLEEPAASLVCSRTLYWHSWTGEDVDADLDRFSRLVGPPGRVIRGSLVLNRILRGAVEAVCTCGVLIRRDAVARAGGFEARFRGLFEDQAFFSKLLARDRVYVMDECLDMYRQHPDSCCAVASQRYEVVHQHRAAFLDWFAQWARAHEVPRSVRRTLELERRLHRRPALVEVRHRLRESVRSAAGHTVSGAFAFARRMLPASLRQRLWSRFGGDRRDERRLAESARRVHHARTDAPRAPSAGGSASSARHGGSGPP